MKDPGCYTHSRNILRARRKPTYKDGLTALKNAVSHIRTDTERKSQT